MKSILVAGSIAAFAALGLAAPASASSDAACFGTVHKTVNAGGVPGFDNVGQLVKSFDGKGGQGKKTLARGMC
jgi:hypothetical protein